MPTAFSVIHEHGRSSFLAQLETFITVVDGLSETELWAASRCRGWSVVDVIVHVHLGLQEMLLGVVSPTLDPASADAATYWSGYQSPPEDAADTSHHLQFVRLITAAHRQASSVVSHLQVTSAALTRGVGALPDGRLDFQDRVLRTGDFLATWAVELSVHHLDLGRELALAPPDPAALRLARTTVEALSSPLPAAWSDERVVLLGTGRLPVDDDVRSELAGLADSLPVFG